jgi:hypothetical protein
MCGRQHPDAQIMFSLIVIIVRFMKMTNQNQWALCSYIYRCAVVFADTVCQIHEHPLYVLICTGKSETSIKQNHYPINSAITTLVC